MLNNLSINDLLRAVREYNEDIVYTVKKLMIWLVLYIKINIVKVESHI